MSTESQRPPLPTAGELDRYLAGEASLTDAARVAEHLARHPGASRAAGEVVHALGAATSPAPDVQANWNAMRARIAEDATHTPGRATPVGSRRAPTTSAWSRRLRWSGVAIGAIAGAVFLAWSIPEFGPTSSSRARTAPTRTYTTQRAQQATVTLPDGSQAVLGPESTLEYVQSAAGARDVTLQGEAYFTVTHDARRPFTVHAGASATRVLGTSFVVRAYPSDSIARVAVVEGKVALESGAATSRAAILLAGDLGRVSPGQRPVVSRVESLSAILGWTRGHLVFEYVPFHAALPDIERAYDVTLQAGDSVVANRTLRVTLTSRSVTDMLNTLALVLDATYTREGRTIVFRSNAP